MTELESATMFYVGLVQGFRLKKNEEGVTFSELKKALFFDDGDNEKLSQILKFLCRNFILLSRTVPSKRGKVMVEYSLSKKGKQLLASMFHKNP